MTWLYFIGLILLYIPVWLCLPLNVLGRKRKVKGRKILVCNHLTLLDPFYLSLMNGGQVYYLAKKELHNNKFLAAILNGLGVVPVDRGKPDLEAIRKIMNLLKKNRTVGIFPEGTRNKASDEIAELKAGTIMFAFKGNAPIVPCVLLKRVKIFRRNFMIIGDEPDFQGLREQKLSAENLDAAAVILLYEMQKLQKILKYYVSLRGKSRRALRAKINNPNIKVQDIYNEIFAANTENAQISGDSVD